MNYYWTQNSSIKQLEESVPSLEILTLFITLIHYLHCIYVFRKLNLLKREIRLLVVVCMDVALVPIYLYYKSDFYRDALMQIIPPLTRAHCTKWKVTWRLTLFNISKTATAKYILHKGFYITLIIWSESAAKSINRECHQLIMQS